MSNTRFNDKSEITSITGSEFIPITDGTNDYKAEVQKIAEYTVSAITIGSSSIKSLISTNSQDIQTLQGIVSTNTIDIQTLESTISTFTTDITDLVEAIVAPVTTPNAVNSAKVNASGYADYIAKVSDTSVVHYAGGSNPNIVETDVLGRTHTITADETITGMTDNGTYEMLKEYDLATGVALASAPVAVNVTGILDGTAISGGDYAGYPASNAFDGTTATPWLASQSGLSTNGIANIGKNFGSVKTVNNIMFYQASGTAQKVSSIKVQSSSNGSTWVDVQTFSVVGGANFLALTTPLVSQYIRILANSNCADATPWDVLEITFNQGTVKEVQVLDTATFYDGDYRTVTGVQPNRQYKKSGGVTTETTFIRRGQVTKTAGTMGTPSSYALGYNQFNAYNLGITQNLSGSGYTKLPNGLILQWGTGMMSGTTAVNTLFPVAFPVGCLMVVAVEQSQNSQDYNLNTTNITASGFCCRKGNGNDYQPFGYIAIGY